MLNSNLGGNVEVVHKIDNFYYPFGENFYPLGENSPAKKYLFSAGDFVEVPEGNTGVVLPLELTGTNAVSENSEIPVVVEKEHVVFEAKDLQRVKIEFSNYSSRFYIAYKSSKQFVDFGDYVGTPGSLVGKVVGVAQIGNSNRETYFYVKTGLENICVHRGSNLRPIYFENLVVNQNRI